MRLFANSLTAVHTEPGMQPVAAQVAPVLVPGCDDIFWMHRLHGALSGHGLHCGDEEMEAWVFGDQTQSALLTYQVSLQAMLLSPMPGKCAVIALHRQEHGLSASPTHCYQGPIAVTQRFHTLSSCAKEVAMS